MTLKPTRPLATANPLDLTAAWLFSEGAGSVVREQLRNAGTAADCALSATVAWETGFHGRNLQFSGTDPRCVMPANTLFNFGSASFSTACRVRFTNATGNRILVHVRNGTLGSGYVWSLSNGNSLNASYTTLSPILAASWTPAANRYYDLAFTRSVVSGSFANTMYVDGVSIGTSSTSNAVTANNGDVWFGDTAIAVSYELAGNLDYFYVANRAWTAEEVRGIFADPYRSFRTPRRRKAFVFYPAQALVPAASGITLESGGPAVVRGTLASTPDAAALLCQSPAATVDRGAIVLTPPAVSLGLARLDPSILRGAVAVGGTPLAIGLASATSEPQRGALLLAPAPAVLEPRANGTSPLRGPLSLTPPAAGLSLPTTPGEILGGAAVISPAPAALPLVGGSATLLRGAMTVAPIANRLDQGTIDPVLIRGDATLIPPAAPLQFETTGRGTPEDVLILPDPARARFATTDPQPVRGGCVLSPVAAQLLLTCSWPGFGEAPYGERASARPRHRLVAPADRDRAGEARPRHRLIPASDRSRYASARPQPRTGDPEC